MKKLYFSIIFRVLGILLNSLAIGYFLFHNTDILISINLIIILALQCWLFIRSMNRTNRDLEHFFRAIRNNDSAFQFNTDNSDYKELYHQYNQLKQDIQAIKLKNEQSNRYFKVLVEHIGIGVISIDENGKIKLCNSAGKTILQKELLRKTADLEQVQTGLSIVFQDIKPGEQKLVTLYRNNEIIQLSLKATILKTNDGDIKLVSFQNIKNELDNKELESWQKLIRVLTHEIMNSISPISSTISTLNHLFIDKETKQPKTIQQINNEILTDTAEGMEIIQERITGMVDFVTRFRSLTLLPAPNFTSINLIDKVNAVIKLIADTLKKEQVQLSFTYPAKAVIVKADTGMLDQILLNIINNALHALKERSDKHIQITLKENEHSRAMLLIKDNGCGISEEIRNEIFVPFFTTKPNGSGIGLSLSRQLMQINGGTLTFTSVPNVFTQFVLQF